MSAPSVDPVGRGASPAGKTGVGAGQNRFGDNDLGHQVAGLAGPVSGRLLSRSELLGWHPVSEPVGVMEIEAPHGDGPSRLALDSIRGQVYVRGLPEHRGSFWQQCSLTSDVNGNQDGVRVLRSVRRTRGGHGEDNNLLSVIRTTENIQLFASSYIEFFIGEFDPGSGRTLAACLTHASRTGSARIQWRTGA